MFLHLCRESAERDTSTQQEMSHRGPITAKICPRVFELHGKRCVCQLGNEEGQMIPTLGISSAAISSSPTLL